MNADVSDSATAKAEVVIYLHVPKTAGMTLTQVIQKQYATTSIIATYGHASHYQDYLSSILPAHMNSTLFIQGHLPFGVHRALEQQAIYFTVLRDPLERLISMYHYILRSPDHPLHEMVTSNNLTLPDIIAEKLSLQFDNGQTRQISGTRGRNAFGQCNSDILKMAKGNLLEHFAVVGLAERFDETLLLLKKTFAWRNVFYVSRNVTPNRPTRDSLDERTKVMLCDLNWLDTELYSWAKERFELRIAEMGKAFQRELATFRLCNAVFGATFRMYEPAKRLITRSSDQ